MSAPDVPPLPRVSPRKIELLRLTTAGSVDDGKSTLIGRLLFDTKQVFEDQIEHVTEVNQRRGNEGVDLALITDGLRAEREQGITIDVAYRYFSTPRRAFILADTPGHVQYTRNMVTGASTANVAIVLVDARTRIVTHTKRHAFTASLLAIPHIVEAVNKMDLEDWDEEAFESIRSEFRDWVAKHDVQDVRYIPLSALKGDMVVSRGENMPWYGGRTLLNLLENLETSNDRNLNDFRFPVQYVCRTQTDALHDFRGYMGKIESGAIAVGEEVVHLPSGMHTHVKEIVTFDGNLPDAGTPLSVCLTLADDIDISRGDMIVRPGNVPRTEREFEATVCWMSDSPLRAETRYLVKHTTRTVRARLKDLRYRIDVDTLHRDESATELGLNEIGRVILRTQQPLFCDDYSTNRVTGAFIVIEEQSNKTVGAGMIWRRSPPPPEPEWSFCYGRRTARIRETNGHPRVGGGGNREGPPTGAWDRRRDTGRRKRRGGPRAARERYSVRMRIGIHLGVVLGLVAALVFAPDVRADDFEEVVATRLAHADPLAEGSKQLAEAASEPKFDLAVRALAKSQTRIDVVRSRALRVALALDLAERVKLGRTKPTLSY
jgi:bifunctional enzyme CysN/CysC